MEKDPARPKIPRIEQLKNNLMAWNYYYWLIFFVIIPFVILLIYALPQTIKNEYFVFYTSDPLRLLTYVLSSYTHTELYPHLVGNLALYLITMFAIFAFENNKKRFHLIAACSLFIVPVICSCLTIGLWHFFGTSTALQGFSGINAAFLAYAFMIGITWFLSGGLEMFDHRESFTGPAWRRFLLYALMTIIVASVVLLGILEGIFIPGSNAISNGIAHFGGFITGLIAFCIVDLMIEKRKIFDGILIILIIIGIISYLGYLIIFVKAVKGL